jgi:hypothetical protein
METNNSQERRDGPLVSKLLAVHRTLTTKAPHSSPYARFARPASSSEQRCRSSRRDNEAEREKNETAPSRAPRVTYPQIEK